MNTFSLCNGTLHVSLGTAHASTPSQLRNLLRISIRQGDKNPRKSMEELGLTDDDFFLAIMNSELEQPISSMLTFLCRAGEIAQEVTERQIER